MLWHSFHVVQKEERDGKTFDYFNMLLNLFVNFSQLCQQLYKLQDNFSKYQLC